MTTPDQPPRPPVPPQGPPASGAAVPPQGQVPPPYGHPGQAPYPGGPHPAVGQPAPYGQPARQAAGAGPVPIWRRGWVIGVAALLVGLGMGSALGRGGTPAPAPAPAVTVTTTQSAAAPAPAPTVTVTAPAEAAKEKTPASCIKALDIAAKAMDAVGDEHLAMASAATQAGKDGDMVKFGTAMAKAMTDMTKTVEGLQPELLVAAQECRAKA